MSPTLVAYEGIGDVDSKWSPKGGIAEGGAFDVRIAVGASATVRQLFATELASMLRARLAANVGYDVVGATNRYAIPLVSGSGGASFLASGTAYIGLETVVYGAKADANTLGDTTAGNMDRGAYNWRSTSKLSRSHKCDLLTYRQPVYVTDHPTVWEGRCVTVLQWLGPPMGVDAASAQEPLLYDVEYKSDHEVEIRKGFITDVELGLDEVVLHCVDLTAAVRGEIGRTATKALLWYRGTAEWVYIPAEGFTIQCRAQSRTAAGTAITATNGAFPITTDGTAGGTLLTGWRQLGALANYIALSVQTQANAINADSVYVDGKIERETDPATGVVERRLVLHARQFDATPLFGTFTLRPSGAMADLLGAVGSGWEEPFGNVGTAYNADDTTNGTAFLDGAMYWRSRPVDGAAVLTPQSQSIIVTADREDGGTAAQTIPTTGYALIRDGDRAEWIAYTGTSTTQLPPGATRLTGCTRGVLGTAALEYAFGADAEPPTVSFQGVLSGALGTLICGVLTSTGAAAYGTYDTLTEDLGLALDPDNVNTASIRGELNAYQRKLPVPEPLDLEHLIEDSAVLHGFVILACTGPDGRYQLRAVSLASPLMHENAIAFSLADGTMLDEPPPRVYRSDGKPIKRIEAKLSSDPVTGEAQGATIYVEDASQHDPSAVTLKLEVPGFVGDATATLLAAAERLFALWGRRYHLAAFATNRTGLAAIPGSTAGVTCGAVYNPDGTTSIATKAVVVRGSYRPWSVGEEPAAELDCALFRVFYGLAPTFQLSAYNAGTPSVTFADNVFTYTTQPIPSDFADDATECRDWHHGPAPTQDFKMEFWIRGDYASRETRTVTGSGAGVGVLSSAFSAALAGVDPAVSTVWAQFQPWGTAGNHARQELYAHISDDSFGLGPDPDDGHEWAA